MKLIKRFFLSFIVNIFIITGANAGSLKEDIDGIVNKAINEKRIVGSVILIYQDGKEIYRSALGFRDRENSIPMTDNTIFRFASLSKPIVALAVLKLMDEGKLNLDDPVTKWLPQFTPQTKNGEKPIITIRHLLTHTAGLSYPFMEFSNGPYHQLGISDGLNNVGYNLEEHIKRLSLAPLVFNPGESWSYSLATDVLGAVIAVVEHKSLPDVVDEQVLNPLGMTHTGFTLKDNPYLVSIPYMDHTPEPLRMNDDAQEVQFGFSSVIFSPSRIFDKNAFPSGGGSISGTADDYVKLLESIRLRSFPLKKETFDNLTSNQTGDFLILSGPGWGWSFAFGILKDPKEAHTPQAIGTYQWGGAWGHAWWVDPKNKLTVVILTNTSVAGLMGRPFAHEIRNAIYAHIGTVDISSVLDGAPTPSLPFS